MLVADPNGYAFRHALIREAMYDDLLPGERSRMHARFAEAIAADESLAAGGAIIQLAHHWYAAHDLGQALASAWQAAAEANRIFAYAEQLSMQARVSELWGKVPDAARRIGTSHPRLLEKAAGVAHLLGEEERARALIAAALREIDPAADAWPPRRSAGPPGCNSGRDRWRRQVRTNAPGAPLSRQSRLTSPGLAGPEESLGLARR